METARTQQQHRWQQTATNLWREQREGTKDTSAAAAAAAADGYQLVKRQYEDGKGATAAAAAADGYQLMKETA
jgi:hypothetical protein